MSAANLLSDLRAFDVVDEATRARARAEAEGYRFRREGIGEREWSWIDFVFGGMWSSEARAGTTIVAERDGELAGFVTYGVPIAAFAFPWLRGWRDDPSFGLFGPFGVAPAHRGSSLGPALLLCALEGLRAAGFPTALIPCVSGERLIAYYASYAHATVAESASLEPLIRPRTLVLASGGGTNLQAVIDAALPLELVGVVTNKTNAYVRERAVRAGIPDEALVWERKTETRTAYDDRLIDAVSRYEPDLVLLLGWMHVLPPRFLARFTEAINIHPAFLPFDGTAETVTLPDQTVIPAFRGAHAIADAVAAGVSWYGATAHALSEEPDRGEILVRKPLPFPAEADAAAALAALRPTEHGVALGAIRRWLFTHQLKGTHAAAP